MNHFDFWFSAENICILGCSHFDPKDFDPRDFDLVYSAAAEILTPGIFDPQNCDNNFFGPQNPNPILDPHHYEMKFPKSEWSQAKSSLKSKIFEFYISVGMHALYKRPLHHLPNIFYDFSIFGTLGYDKHDRNFVTTLIFGL